MNTFVGYVGKKAIRRVNSMKKLILILMLVFGMNVMATETLQCLLINIAPLSKTEMFTKTVSMVEDATSSFSDIHLLEGVVVIDKTIWEYLDKNDKENLIFAYVCYIYDKTGSTDLAIYVNSVLVFHSYESQLLKARLY